MTLIMHAQFAETDDIADTVFPPTRLLSPLHDNQPVQTTARAAQEAAGGDGAAAEEARGRAEGTATAEESLLPETPRLILQQGKAAAAVLLSGLWYVAIMLDFAMRLACNYSHFLQRPIQHET